MKKNPCSLNLLIVHHQRNFYAHHDIYTSLTFTHTLRLQYKIITSQQQFQVLAQQTRKKGKCFDCGSHQVLKDAAAAAAYPLSLRGLPNVHISAMELMVFVSAVATFMVMRGARTFMFN